VECLGLDRTILAVIISPDQIHRSRLKAVYESMTGPELLVRWTALGEVHQNDLPDISCTKQCWLNRAKWVSQQQATLCPWSLNFSLSSLKVHSTWCSNTVNIATTFAVESTFSRSSLSLSETVPAFSFPIGPNLKFPLQKQTIKHHLQSKYSTDHSRHRNRCQLDLSA
jgi:hypothetical protein